MRRSEGHQRVRDNCVPWIQHCRGFNNESAIGRSVTVQQLIANGRRCNRCDDELSLFMILVVTDLLWQAGETAERNGAVVAKTRLLLRSLRRIWLKFVKVHGQRVGLHQLPAEGLGGDQPCEKHAREFINFVYKDRTNFSTVGRIGRGKSAAMQAQYLLCKYIYPKLYSSWAAFSEEELEKHCAPLTCVMKAQWKSLVVNEMQPEVHGTGMPFVKQRWTDQAYRLAQDYYLFGGEVGAAAGCLRLAIMGFVRTTCCRSGSFTKDQADKQGLTRFAAVNVLSVGDFTWDPFGMEIAETSECAALRGEVEIHRVKRYYMELYKYRMSVTPDMLTEEARRASTLIAAYLFSRGLFLVQYDGMSTECIEASLAKRRLHGHRMGMPDGARVAAKAAVARWIAGERGYLPQLMGEPLFAKEMAGDRFGSKECSVADVARAYCQAAEALGFQPNSSGVNSGRRNAVIALRRGLEVNGESLMLSKKFMNHRGKAGCATIEASYDDDCTHDIGAYLCGRAPLKTESMSVCLAVNRSVELSKIRRFADVPKDSAEYQELYASSNELDDLVSSVEELRVAAGDTSTEGAALLNCMLKEELKLMTNCKQKLKYRVLQVYKHRVWADEVAKRKSTGYYLQRQQVASVVKSRDTKDMKLSDLMLQVCKVVQREAQPPRATHAVGAGMAGRAEAAQATRAEKVQRFLAKRARQDQTRRGHVAAAAGARAKRCATRRQLVV